MSIISDARRMRPIIEKAVQSLSDFDAMGVVSLYPDFDTLCAKSYKAENAGYKFTYGGKLWKTVQPGYTFAAHYAPGVGTESLYERIDETHDGSEFDPIPYDGNMVLESGKYYTQSGVTYLCTRDSGIALHHTLAELVGQYVELA